MRSTVDHTDLTQTNVCGRPIRPYRSQPANMVNIYLVLADQSRSRICLDLADHTVQGYIYPNDLDHAMVEMESI